MYPSMQAPVNHHNLEMAKATEGGGRSEASACPERAQRVEGTSYQKAGAPARACVLHASPDCEQLKKESASSEGDAIHIVALS
jgi:hypothetical protein